MPIGKYIGSTEYNEIFFFYKNKFFYLINLCEGYGQIYGTITIKDKIISCSIDTRSYWKFGEDDTINLIKLEMISNNLFKRITDIGCNIHSDRNFKSIQTIQKKSRVDNLRLREYASINSNIITNLNRGTIVSVLNVVKKVDVINGQKGNWVFVKTENDYFGYCFDVYLE